MKKSAYIVIMSSVTRRRRRPDESSPVVSQSVKRRRSSTTSARLPTSIFVPTEGEDTDEAHLTFLISMMGGSAFDLYVETYVVVEPPITVMQVEKPLYVDKALLADGNPRIFYGKKSTHFTCTTGDGKLWESYGAGFQMRASDHFCQTFALSHMVHHFFPDSEVGRMYAQFEAGDAHFYENAYVAKEIACLILETLNNRREFDDKMWEYIEDELSFEDRGMADHELHPKYRAKYLRGGEWANKKLLADVIAYCRGITVPRMMSGSFREKIFL